MVLVLSVYFVLLKKEVENDKKTAMLGYEDKNIYNEKLNFLDHQEVCVSTLWQNSNDLSSFKFKRFIQQF